MFSSKLFLLLSIWFFMPNTLALTEKQAFVQFKQSETYYFSDALIYEYQSNGAKEELWLYVNPKTKQILYLPKDDMIKGVISFPNGSYKVFCKTEFGKDTILTQVVKEVLYTAKPIIKLLPLNKTKLIDQKNIQQKPIFCSGFEFDYLKMAGSETLYITKQIALNARQIYGFSKLDGDAKLNIDLNYLSLLSRNQLITHVNRSNFSLKLVNYGPNPYYLTLE